MIDLIAFDADDTLWHNEHLYTRGLERFRKLMARYPVKGPIDSRQQEIEVANLRYYGYGVSSFVLSLIEAAIELTGGQVSGSDLSNLLDLAKEMYSAEVELYDQALETVAALSQKHPLMLVTKGDLRHQESKLARSGLEKFFSFVEIVSDKTPETYTSILARHGIDPERFLMVGDSLRSDILPVLQLGGWAVYVPNSGAWAHEQAGKVEASAGRFFQVDGIGQLPELVDRLDQSN